MNKVLHRLISFFFFFNDTATTEIYPLSLHDALPICLVLTTRWEAVAWSVPAVLFTILYPFTKRFFAMPQAFLGDRKSTRLNSSHLVISYAVFCLKKKKQYKNHFITDLDSHLIPYCIE